MSWQSILIVERRDKSLWMLVRAEYGIGQAISRDGGKSWCESGPSGIRNAVSRFFIRWLNSGKLLIVPLPTAYGYYVIEHGAIQQINTVPVQTVIGISGKLPPGWAVDRRRFRGTDFYFD